MNEMNVSLACLPSLSEISNTYLAVRAIYVPIATNQMLYNLYIAALSVPA